MKQMKHLSSVRVLRTIVLIASCILFFVSCKRENLPSGQGSTPNAGQQQDIDKVKAWLLDQEAQASEDRPARIANLQANLDFDGMRTETLYNGQTMLVVPVKKGFVTENSKGKDPLNSLVLRLNAAGKITRGNIIQYLSKQRPMLDKLPANFFHDFYNGGITGLTATITFLSVAGELQAEVTRDNGKLVSNSEVKRKPKDSGPGGKISIECYDVWWVTYYPDGSSTWDFLYSFCTGGEQPCKSALVVNGKNYLVGCGGGGGDEEGVELTRPLQWTVWTSADHTYGVVSIETVKGKRTGGGTGYFTNINHSNSSGFGDNQYFTETQSVVTQGTSYVSSALNGQLYRGSTPIEVHNEKSWQFQEIF
jgi:hypothetical protein